MPSELVLSLRSPVTFSMDEFGAKAAVLQKLTRAGLDVPAGFAIGRDAFRLHAEAALPGQAGPLLERMMRAPPSLLERTRDAILATALPASIAAEVAAAYAALGAGPVAVRSSSTREDLATLSGAGLQDSFLNVGGTGPVIDAVRACWASLATERAVQYLRQMGVSGGEIGVGVVVQRMVPAEVAGVVFTANPVSGRRNEIVIDCSWGLGPSIVGGTVSPDSFVVDRDAPHTYGRQRHRVG